MALTRKHVSDVDTLRALAHPLRVRLLGALRVDGPATASQLGRRFGESSGSTSYHLRQLERFGFVVEDDQQPSRRERRWRAAHDVTSFHPVDFLDEDEGREVVRALDQQWLRLLVDVVQTWNRERPSWPREWIEAADKGDVVIRLRPDDVRELSRELFEVIQRRAADPRPASDPDARPVIIHVLATPLTEDAL